MEAGQRGPAGPQANPHPQELILISGEGGHRLELGARESDSPAVMGSPNTYPNSSVKQVFLVRSPGAVFQAALERYESLQDYMRNLLRPAHGT